MICLNIPYDYEVARIVAQVGFVGCIVAGLIVLVAGVLAFRMERERQNLPRPKQTMDIPLNLNHKEHQP